jgi:phage-related protein
MKLEIDIRVLKFLKQLPDKDSVKAISYIELFEKYQFSLDTRYLKKVSGPIWELRPGRIRLYLLIKSPKQIVIYAIIKKSQKITKADLKTIQSRLKEYL